MIRLRPRGQFAPLAFAACLLLAAFVLAPVFAGERDLQKAKPADVGMDPAGLEKLSEAMHGMVDDGKLAGVVTMVSRKGKVVLFDAYGKQDIENGVPVAKDSIFRIYSMTKPIIGTALMTYYDEGRFTLDDPVSKFIPEFADLKVAKEDGPDGMPVVEDADHPMTMRELMSHTAGLTYGLFSQSQVDTLYQKAGIILDSTLTVKEMVGRLAKIPLRQQPGSMWHYSVAVDVQGYVLEVLGGKPLDEVLNERVFGPLGMTDTAFHVEAAKADRFSRIYATSDGKLASPPNGQYLKKPNFLSGGGGMVSTAMDYMLFAQMLANGGELERRPDPEAGDREADAHRSSARERHRHGAALPGQSLRPRLLDRHRSEPGHRPRARQGRVLVVRHRRHLVRHQPGPGSGHRRHDPEPRFPCLGGRALHQQAARVRSDRRLGRGPRRCGRPMTVAGIGSRVARIAPPAFPGRARRPRSQEPEELKRRVV